MEEELKSWLVCSPVNFANSVNVFQKNNNKKKNVFKEIKKKLNNKKFCHTLKMISRNIAKLVRDSCYNLLLCNSTICCSFSFECRIFFLFSCDKRQKPYNTLKHMAHQKRIMKYDGSKYEGEEETFFVLLSMLTFLLFVTKLNVKNILQEKNLISNWGSRKFQTFD